MNAYSVELWAIVLIVTFALATGFTLFARWCSFSSAVDQKKLDNLRVGMTAAEVTDLLGAPREKRAGEKNVELWVYGSRFKRHLLVLEFNGTGKMNEFVHGVPHTRKPNKMVED